MHVKILLYIFLNGSGAFLCVTGLSDHCFISCKYGKAGITSSHDVIILAPGVRDLAQFRYKKTCQHVFWPGMKRKICCHDSFYIYIALPDKRVFRQF